MADACPLPSDRCEALSIAAKLQQLYDQRETSWRKITLVVGTITTLLAAAIYAGYGGIIGRAEAAGAKAGAGAGAAECTRIQGSTGQLLLDARQSFKQDVDPRFDEIKALIKDNQARAAAASMKVMGR
jgi:hypothetical protein